jgi:hypothetical protein
LRTTTKSTKGTKEKLKKPPRPFMRFVPSVVAIHPLGLQ